MPETDGENVAAGQLPQNKKDKWDKADTISKWAAVLATAAVPIVIGVASCRIQKSIAKQSVRIQRSVADQSVAKDYVGIAVSILERPKEEEHDALRDWSVDLLKKYTPLQFTPQQEEELRSGGLALVGPGEFLSAVSSSPDGKTVAVIKHAMSDQYPGGRFIAEIYDGRTGKMIFQFNIGTGILKQDLKQTRSVCLRAIYPAISVWIHKACEICGLARGRSFRSTRISCSPLTFRGGFHRAISSSRTK